MLDVRNLSFCYGRDTSVLDQISFSLAAGSILSLIGPNGAGKTTCLKCIAGLVHAPKNSITLAQKAIEQYRPSYRASLIGYVPQECHLSIPHSLEEFLAISRYPSQIITKLSPGEQAAIIHDALKLVRLERKSCLPVTHLSGGERRRLLIAAALVNQPRVLLLDEPNAFLDPAHQSFTERLLLQLRREYDLAIILVTHDLNLALRCSDGVIALRDGRIAYSGSPDTVISSEQISDLYETPLKIVSLPGESYPYVVGG